jgi:S-adenosylmethionine:diacylglycerol 3-amino-3-carboxypropyl transferase
MLNRGVFTRTYSSEFFRHVENPSFSRHFRGLVERTLRELPVGDNYFLHFLIEGRYRAELPGGLPVYLEASGAGLERSRGAPDPGRRDLHRVPAHVARR